MAERKEKQFAVIKRAVDYGRTIERIWWFDARGEAREFERTKSKSMTSVRRGLSTLTVHPMTRGPRA